METVADDAGPDDRGVPVSDGGPGETRQRRGSGEITRRIDRRAGGAETSAIQQDGFSRRHSVKIGARGIAGAARICDGHIHAAGGRLRRSRRIDLGGLM